MDGRSATSDAGAALAADQPQHDHRLGVVFVHGIGDQKRGETLGTWATALVRWLRGWLGGGTDGTRVVLSEAPVDRVSVTGDNEKIEAARLRVTIDRKERSWLLAESWWARSVTPPPIGRFGSWLARVVPFLAVAQVWPHVRYNAEQLGGLLTRGSGGSVAGVGRAIEVVVRVIRSIAAVLLLAVAIPLSAVMVVAVWVVLLLLRLPLPGWRDRIDKFVVAVAASLGDAYLLVQDPLQYDRMRDTVRRDVEAVAQICDAVVIVAHSQGAAIAHDVLRDLARDAGPSPWVGRIRMFASVGSGIWKLYRLREVFYGLKTGVTLAPVWGMMMVGGAGALALYGGLVGTTLQVTMAIALALVGAVLLGRGLRDTLAKVDAPGAFTLDVARFAAGFRWVDFWSTADPVPNGPLVVGEADGQSEPCTRKLYNLSSMLADHSAYALNNDQFWPLLVGELFSADTGDDYWTSERDGQQFDVVPVPNWRDEELLPAWRQRRNRVLWLVYGRVVTGVLAAMALVTAPWLRVDIGDRLLGFCTRAGVLPAGLRQACGAPAPGQTDPAWYAGLVEQFRQAPELLGGLALALVVLAGFTLLARPLWRSWQRDTDEIVTHGRRPADPSLKRAVFQGLMVVFWSLTVVAVLGLPAGGATIAGASVVAWLFFYYVRLWLDARAVRAQPSGPAGDVDAATGPDVDSVLAA
jgi:hypothetical protein